MIQLFREIFGAKDPIPRFRLPFDPVFDLSLVRGTYELKKALEIDPDEGLVQFYLANSPTSREGWTSRPCRSWKGTPDSPTRT